VEVEVDELFAQREETQQHIHHVSDIENVGASNNSNSNDESDEFPDLANMDLSSGDTEDSSNAPDDDKVLHVHHFSYFIIIPRGLSSASLCHIQYKKGGGFFVLQMDITLLQVWNKGPYGLLRFHGYLRLTHSEHCVTTRYK
jgi:hypothetical protein